MSKRVPDKISLPWLLHSPMARNIFQYGDQHKGAFIISPSGKVVPGRYTHTSKGVGYDLRDVETSAEPAIIPPPVLSVTEDDPNQELDVTWTLPKAYDTLHLERSEDQVAWTALATLPGNQAAYDDAAVTVGTEYFYRIRGQVGGAYSAYSNIDSGMLVAAGFALMGCGQNSDYELGDSQPAADVVTFVNLDIANTYLDAAGGQVNSAFIRSDGTLWAVGLNGRGQLGDGTDTDRTAIAQSGIDSDWASFMGFLRNGYVAKKTNGEIYGWGANGNGELGLGDDLDRWTPVLIGDDTEIASVGCGWYHMLVVKTDGTLWATGRNSSGQLGLGDTSERQSLTQVGSDTNWAFAAAGEEHSIAIKTDGSTYVFGLNNEGQLGLGVGDVTSRNTPTLLTGFTCSAASAGVEFTVLIKTDGTMWAAGEGSSRQLGQGVSSTDSEVFIQIGSDTDWVTVRSGFGHSIAKKVARDVPGALYAWGDGTGGQLGQGNDDNLGTPTQMGGSSSFRRFSAGERHSLAIEE